MLSVMVIAWRRQKMHQFVVRFEDRAYTQNQKQKKQKTRTINSTYHKDEVSHSRGVHRSTCAGAHNHTQLGDHAGRLHVLQEHVSIASKGINSLLDSFFLIGGRTRRKIRRRKRKSQRQRQRRTTGAKTVRPQQQQQQQQQHKLQ
jgi:hypothetical protein